VLTHIQRFLLYQHYSSLKTETQPPKPLNYGSTYENGCRPKHRCKNTRTCKTCHNIHLVKTLNNTLSHITDKTLKKFKHASYVTITPSVLTNQELFEEHNNYIDDFQKYLTNSTKRKSKKHPLYNCEYIIFKEITRTKDNNELLPHLHIIVLSQIIPSFPGYILSAEVQKIDTTLNPKYDKYNDYKNPLTTTLKTIFAYSSKFDKDRANFEVVSRVSRNKSDIKISKLFKPKTLKSNNLFPIHINKKRAILNQALKARQEAIKEHKSYKATHARAKGITIHRHALKTQRNIKKIEANKQYLLKRLDMKLKHSQSRKSRSKRSTHTP